MTIIMCSCPSFSVARSFSSSSCPRKLITKTDSDTARSLSSDRYFIHLMYYHYHQEVVRRLPAAPPDQRGPAAGGIHGPDAGITGGQRGQIQVTTIIIIIIIYKHDH